jgi:hypothetical protein
MNYAEYIRADQRLIILKALASTPDYTQNSTILLRILDDFGHRMASDDLVEQLEWLAGDEAAAISLKEAGSILVASLTKAGKEHVERRRIIAGIKQPNPEI